MNLRVVLVEPIYEGNIGSIARAMKNFAASFRYAAPVPTLAIRPEYYRKRANVISKHRQKLKMNWHVKQEDFQSVLERYNRHQKGRGFSESSIERYSNILRNFLKFADDVHPSTEKANEYRDHLIAKKQAGTSNNQQLLLCAWQFL